jgi:outer membrane protein TolC
VDRVRRIIPSRRRPCPASYRQTVLTGFKEVEDNLAALRILEEEAIFQDAAVKAAQQLVTVTMNKYQAGTVTFSM